MYKTRFFSISHYLVLLRTQWNLQEAAVYSSSTNSNVIQTGGEKDRKRDFLNHHLTFDGQQDKISAVKTEGVPVGQMDSEVPEQMPCPSTLLHLSLPHPQTDLHEPYKSFPWLLVGFGERRPQQEIKKKEKSEVCAFISHHLPCDSALRLLTLL